MKKVALAKSILSALFFFISTLLYAQHTFRTTSSGTIIGYMEYLPADYHNNSDKYPVLIFLHGVDERGANSTDPAVLQTTINSVIKLGPPQHVKNGEQFPFILITPQLKNSYGSWPASYVREVIEHCKTYLRIDERRIHITGLSMGGHGTWTCIEDTPSIYASAAPVCGAHNTPAKACGIARENVAVWAFHGDADPVVSYTKTTNMVNAINACSPAPTPLAKASIYANVQHNAWYRAYYLTNNYHTPNFYQWVMQQSKSKRGGNNIPLANAGGDRTISSTSVVLSGSGSDNGGSIVSYNWSQLQGPSRASLSGTSSTNLTASNLITGSYVFKLTVTDNGGLVDSDFVKVTVSGAGSNTPPVVNAGIDRTLNMPDNTVSLTGTASDNDGTISSYSWSKVSGGTATLSGTSTATLNASNLALGTYTFRLTVKDDKGSSNSDDVVVIVNNPPSVSVGEDIDITLPTNSVTIQGVASDGDGSITSYSWKMTTGTDASLSGTSTSKLTASSLSAGSYVFRLTVKDNTGASTFDDVKVNVYASRISNNAPSADAGEDRLITLPTSAISITGSGTDADGTISSYSWTKVSGGNATLSGTNTATLSASSLSAGSYTFRLSVTDNMGSSNSDDVIVTVNQPPVVSVGADLKIILPDNSVSIQGTASDPDGTITAYAWKMTTGTVATLSGTNTSRLTATGLVEGPYVFRLFATDNRGATKFDDVKIVVSADPNQNEAPFADAGEDQLITLPSNSIEITGSGSDSDGSISSYSWTKLSGPSASLSGTSSNTLVASSLSAGIYVFRLSVVDNGGSTATDDVTVIVNAPPTVSVGADYTLTLPVNYTSIQGSASDADGTITAYSWKMTTGTVANLSGTNTSRLTATGLIEGPYVFRLFVTDDKGATKFDDVKIVVKSTSTDNTIPNSPPTADAGSDRVITLPTNSITITGDGADSDGTITRYSWSKVSGGAATLSNATSATLTASALNSGTYVFRLTVTDNGGATDWDDVTVLVNSPPVVSVGSDFSITLPTNSLSVQGSVSDDGTIVAYEWKMTTGTVATLSGTNTSRLTATGLIEGPYVFRLFATDNHGAKKFDDVKIWVKPNPNNASPTADAGDDQLVSLPTNSVTLSGTGTDPDGEAVSYNWTKVSGGSATMSGATSSSLTVSNLVAGTYVFRLTVKDASGIIDADDVMVTVNQPPIVSVGADFSITLPSNSLTVQGVASDPDGSIVEYKWLMTTGTIASLSGTTTSKLTASGLVEGSYVFRLFATDNHGAKKFDDVKIWVKPASTSATAMEGEDSAFEAFLLAEELSADLRHDDNQFWKDKQVILYDASGRQTYSGQWTIGSFDTLVESGKMYVYNILEKGKKIRQGKFVVIK